VGLGQTYSKAVAANAELFWIDSSGAVVQLTSGGSIAAVDGVAMVDNSATAFEVREAAVVYLAVSTVNGSESFTAGGNANLASALTFDQVGVTATGIDNVADTFKVEDTGGTRYIGVSTVTGLERVTLGNGVDNASVFIDGTGGLQFSRAGAQRLDAEQSAAEVAGVDVTFSAGDGGDDAGAVSGAAGTTFLTGATGGDGSGNVSGDGGDVIVAGGNSGLDGGGGFGFPGNTRIRGGTGDFDGSIHIGDLNTDGVGFFGATPVSRPNVTGSRGGNAALADLLTDLALLGLITDSSSA
jgi:hypothetical protein